MQRASSRRIRWKCQKGSLRAKGRSGALAVDSRNPYSIAMEVQVSAATAKKLNDLATSSGRAPEDIVEDALAGYLEEVASVRKTLERRFDDLKSGRANPIDGEEALRRLSEKSERRRSGG
jgi:predicted transcriptional regulator